MAPPTLHSLEQHDLGLTWVVDDAMRRASHALVDEGRVWLVDPVDVPEAIDRATGLGELAGVVQLLDRHPRDGKALAARFGVPYLRLPASLPGTPFEVVTVVDVPKWRELALWWPERQALVVPEAVGTAPYFKATDQDAGVHMMLRLKPPGRLRTFAPQHLLVGHGPALHGAAVAPALADAVARSRRDLPAVLVKLPRDFRPAAS